MNTSATRMQCMEVWGGNRETERAFELPGIQAWVNSSPDGDATAGGDVYYLSSCASGRITRTLLADVSGHGEAAASVAVGLRDLMRQFVNVISQDRLVMEMNQRFAEYSDNSHFATAIVTTYFAPTRSLMVSNAGHPSPYLYRQSTGEWSIVEQVDTNKEEVTGTPLGVFDEAEYPPQKFVLETGDRLFFYSDALIESVGTDGTMLGTSGLTQLLQQLAGVASTDLIAKLLKAIDERSGFAQTEDDRTAILLEANNSGTRLKDNLLAPIRIFRQATLNTDLS